MEKSITTRKSSESRSVVKTRKQKLSDLEKFILDDWDFYQSDDEMLYDYLSGRMGDLYEEKEENE